MYMTVMNEKYSVRGTHFRLFFVLFFVGVFFFWGGGSIRCYTGLFLILCNFLQLYSQLVFWVGVYTKNNQTTRPDCLIVIRGCLCKNRALILRYLHIFIMNYTLGSNFRTGERNMNNFFIGQLQPTVSIDPCVLFCNRK